MIPLGPLHENENGSKTIVERVGEVFRHRVFERFFAEETSREKISRRCSQSSVNTGYSALAAGTSTVR